MQAAGIIMTQPFFSQGMCLVNI